MGSWDRISHQPTSVYFYGAGHIEDVRDELFNYEIKRKITKAADYSSCVTHFVSVYFTPEVNL